MSPTIPILSILLLSLISGSTAGEQSTDFIQVLRGFFKSLVKTYKKYEEEVILSVCWTRYLLEDDMNKDKLKMIRKRSTMNEADQASRAASNNYMEWNSKIDEDGNSAPMINYLNTKRRRRAVSIVPKLLQGAPRDGHEFSSRGTSSHAVNPTPNPRDHDKVHFGSTDLEEEDSRKVLRSPTSHRDSSVEDALPRSFSLIVTRGEPLGNQKFPFQRYLSQKRNSSADEISSDPMPQKDHGIEEHPAGAPLNNNGNVECSRKGVIKLMDSEGNLSCNPTINSKTPRRKREELSRDSLLSPQAGSTIAERSFPKSRASGGEVVKRNAPLKFEMVSGSDTRKRHSQQSREEGTSRDGRVLTVTIPPFFLPEFEQSHQQMLHKNHGFPSVPTIPQKSRQDALIRTARSTSSVSNVRPFAEDYENLTNKTVQHVKQIVSQASRDRSKRSLELSAAGNSFVTNVYTILQKIAGFGRRVIKLVITNHGIVCTIKYLWTKFYRWIETATYEYQIDRVSY